MENKENLIKQDIQIIERGPVILAPFTPGIAIKKAVALSHDQLVKMILDSGLKERGGGSVAVGTKWETVKNTQSKKKYILCNADEGDPGVYKDEELIKDRAEMIFEGMVIAGYATGASEGVFYLRHEYIDLKDIVEKVIDDMKNQNVLGSNIAGKDGFDFNIKIQIGAGAYISGEESALVAVEEGKKLSDNEAALISQKGYHNYPTVVSTVESYCSVSKILIEGSEWFSNFGTDKSKGTRIIAVTGDCERPGIYEIEWGASINEIIKMAGGDSIKAVIAGGPSGIILNKKDFKRRICFENISTGASIILIGKERSILNIVHILTNFFEDESCGWCVPCRAGIIMLKKKIEKIADGHGIEKDITELGEWCNIVRVTSRCGLGQTSVNPILTSIQNFKDEYKDKLQDDVDFATEFNIDKALSESYKMTGKKPASKDK